VFGFSPLYPWQASRFLKECDADIYHSCEPSFTTYLAMRAMPHRKHMVTFRDPRDMTDWRMEFDLPSVNKLQVVHNYFFENNLLVRKCIKNMDAVFTIAKYLCPKVKRMYGLNRMPQFLPTPVQVPDIVHKADKPTVCYLARLDRRKRPTLFLDLASKFPHVHFITIGKSRDPKWDHYLRRRYAGIPNLEMVGFVDQFSSKRHAQFRNKSWIMINTATREALPNSFLESAAQKCAIISHVDPDGFASNFGYHAREDDFTAGLTFLLENDRWRQRGEAGHKYVKAVFATDLAMDRHMAIYQSLIQQSVS
jgi:glycosyltransferase involved in cell wall biosynthesis